MEDITYNVIPKLSKIMHFLRKNKKKIKKVERGKFKINYTLKHIIQSSL